jgi:GxxExxY protein
MTRVELFEGQLTRSVIGAYYEVYNNLGFGFLERFYVTALERELLERGHKVAREVSVNVLYKGQELGSQRLDLIVDERLVLETKATSDLHKSATRQLYNYLRATNLELGLLLHFGPEPKFYRVICRHQREDPEGPAPIRSIRIAPPS